MLLRSVLSLFIKYWIIWVWFVVDDGCSRFLDFVGVEFGWLEGDNGEFMCLVLVFLDGLVLGELERCFCWLLFINGFLLIKGESVLVGDIILICFFDFGVLIFCVIELLMLCFILFLLCFFMKFDVFLDLELLGLWLIEVLFDNVFDVGNFE